MVGKRDWKYGPHIYAPVWRWDEEGAIHSMFDAVATKLNALFDHIYFKQIRYDSDGQPVPSWIDIGLNASLIEGDFIQLYGERYIAFPFYPCSDEGNAASERKMNGAIAAVLDRYEWKYRKLVETLGLVYDPIENYNMTETGSDTDTPSGTTTKTHTIDIDKVSMIRLNGAASATINEGTGEDAGKYSIHNFALTVDKEIITKVDTISDTQNGQKAGRSLVNDSIALEDGSTLETKNYTTTMDSSATGRLHSYNQTTGTVGQSNYNNLTEKIPIMGEIQAGNPTAYSYTDTETYANRTNTKAHSLSRSGNIGVTTSQQMIEQERELVRYSVWKEFFEDLNRELLLSVWD